MTNLLVINSSPDLQNSVSRKLSKAFVTEYTIREPDVTIIDRDLITEPVGMVDSDTLTVIHGHKRENLTESESNKLILTNKLFDEWKQADVIVIASPVYNYSLPAQLKGYLDMMVSPGLGFVYGDKGPEGTLAGKKVYALTATAYGYDTMEQMGKNHHKDLLKAMLGNCAITDITFFEAKPRNEESVASAVENIKVHIHTELNKTI